MEKISSHASPSAVAGIFRPFDHHLVIANILAGQTPGSVYVDDPQCPRLGLAWYKYRVFLVSEAGDPVPDKAAVAAAGQVLCQDMLPEALAARQDAFILATSPFAWAAHLEALVPGRKIIPAVRQYFACHRLKQDWRPRLPDGFELLPANAALLERLNPAGREALSEEMTSERPSVADFLDKSFGVCLVQGDELVGWCLSEYNHAGRCEVGVATMEPYQQRGLGTLMSLALVEQALARGYHTIGWHCWIKNTASSALARRAGFEYVHDEPVSILILEE